MKPADVIRAIAKEERWTLNAMSKEMGYAFSTGLGNTINKSDRLRVDTILKCLDFLGYELVARPKKKGLGLGTYTITLDEENKE